MIVDLDTPALLTLYLAERLGLRGYDCVHLAAAERAFDGAGRPAAFMLAAFDNDLRRGADALGIPVSP